MNKEKELFQIAKHLYQAKLWNDFWDMDIIALQLPNRKEPVFVSVLGKAEGEFGFLVCRDLEDLAYFFETARKTLGNEFEDAVESIASQKCLSLTYENREDLDKEDYQRIKDSGVTFRGKKAWPIFTDYRPGYYPDDIAEEEIPFMIEVLEKFLETGEAFREQADFYEDQEMEEVLMRTYHEDGTYEDGRFTIPGQVFEGLLGLSLEEAPVEVTKFEMKRAERLPMGEAIWELDINFVPLSGIEQENERAIFPKMMMVIDAKSGEVILAEFIQQKKTEEIQRIFLQLLLKQMVKPPTIVLNFSRVNQVAAVLGSLMRELRIEAVPVQKLPLIAAAQEEMFHFFDHYPL